MKEIQKIVLDLIRCANRENIVIGEAVGEICKAFHFTNQEIDEIAEILKADMREKFASLPTYDTLNTRISKMSRENPYGL